MKFIYNILVFLLSGFIVIATTGVNFNKHECTACKTSQVYLFSSKENQCSEFCCTEHQQVHHCNSEITKTIEKSIKDKLKDIPDYEYELKKQKITKKIMEKRDLEIA